MTKIGFVGRKHWGSIGAIQQDLIASSVAFLPGLKRSQTEGICMPQVQKFERPLVTFAVFAYNQERYIRAAVEGAFSQTYSPLEIILSDDCSTDRTFAIMEEMAAGYKGPHAVRTRKNDRNLGLAGHINAFVAASKGEIICWAAGDDVSLPHRTSQLALPMINDPEIYGTHSKFYTIDIHGNKTGLYTRPSFYRPFVLDDIVTHEYRVVSQTHAFRKKVFDVFGPLLKSGTHEAAIMAFREAALGKVEFIDQPTILYRLGSGVSTYNGQDVMRLQRDEPLKVTNWSLSFYKQLMVDLEKFEHLKWKYDRLAQKRRFYYERLKLINSSGWQFRALVSILSENGFDGLAMRAFARSSMPVELYRFVMVLKGLVSTLKEAKYLRSPQRGSLTKENVQGQESLTKAENDGSSDSDRQEERGYAFAARPSIADPAESHKHCR
jgi:glycosyltransferase involved in cell wall biosynthesis